MERGTTRISTEPREPDTYVWALVHETNEPRVYHAVDSFVGERRLGAAPEWTWRLGAPGGFI